jgi:hypothetical protein
LRLETITLKGELLAGTDWLILYLAARRSFIFNAAVTRPYLSPADFQLTRKGGVLAQSTNTELRDTALKFIEQWATRLPDEPAFSVTFHTLCSNGALFPGVELLGSTPHPLLPFTPPSFVPVAPQPMYADGSEPPPPSLLQVPLRVGGGGRVWMLDPHDAAAQPVLLTGPAYAPLRCAPSLPRSTHPPSFLPATC